MDYIVDPVHGRTPTANTVCRVICLHVDDLFMTGTPEFYEKVATYLHKHFQTGSEDKNDNLFVGQRIRWLQD